MNAKYAAPLLAKRHTPWLYRCAMAGAVVVLILHALYWFPQANDDAFISLRYARNLALGLGPSYNPPERVEGYSNPLWVFLLALAARLGIRDLLLAAKIMGLIAALACLPLAGGLFRRLYPQLPLWWSLTPAYFLATSHLFASWSVWALEVPLYAFLILAAVYLHQDYRHRTAPGLAATALLFLAVALSRPEGIIYLGLPAAAAFAPRHAPERKKRQLMLATLAVAGFIIFLLWRRSTFGEIVPNTFYAKTADATPFWRPRGIRYLRFFLFGQSFPFSLLFLAGGIAAAASRRRRMDLFLPLGMGLFAAWYVNGDWMANYRFLVPILPLIAVIIGAAPLTAIRLGARSLPRRLLLSGWLAAAAWFAIYGLAGDADLRYTRGEGSLRTKENFLGHLRAPWGRAGTGFQPILWNQTRWIMEHAGQNDVTALSDIGFLGWATNVPIYDTLALVNPSLARLYHRRRALGRGLPDKLHADFDRASPRFVFLRQKINGGDGINPLEKSLLADSSFKSSMRREKTFPVSAEYEMALYISPEARSPAPETVKERYRRAIRWNPRIRRLYLGFHDWCRKNGDAACREEAENMLRGRFPNPAAADE